MKSIGLGGLCGLVFASVCFGLFYYAIPFIPDPYFPEDWYVFIIPILVPIIVGAYGAYDLYGCRNSFGDILVYIGKVILSAVASSIVNYIAIVIIGIVYTLATGTFLDFFITIIVIGCVGAPATIFLVGFFE